jgi:uncharacterized protein YdhG (YjbR/CyaY superfamily)
MSDEKKATFSTIDEYIALFPPEVQARLKTIRATIKAAAPEATEKISYQMPTFYLEGNLVYFGAYKNHIGFYPTPGGLTQFEAELAPYKVAKGTAQFPHDQPLPLDLITQIVKFRAAENLKKAAEKPRKRKPKSS